MSKSSKNDKKSTPGAILITHGVFGSKLLRDPQPVRSTLRGSFSGPKSGPNHPSGSNPGVGGILGVNIGHICCFRGGSNPCQTVWGTFRRVKSALGGGVLGPHIGPLPLWKGPKGSKCPPGGSKLAENRVRRAVWGVDLADRGYPYWSHI